MITLFFDLVLMIFEDPPIVPSNYFNNSTDYTVTELQLYIRFCLCLFDYIVSRCNSFAVSICTHLMRTENQYSKTFFKLSGWLWFWLFLWNNVKEVKISQIIHSKMSDCCNFYDRFPRFTCVYVFESCIMFYLYIKMQSKNRKWWRPIS